MSPVAPTVPVARTAPDAVRSYVVVVCLPPAPSDATKDAPFEAHATSVLDDSDSVFARTSVPFENVATRRWSGSASRIRPDSSTSKDDGPSVSDSTPGTSPAFPLPVPHGRYSAVAPEATTPNGTVGTATVGMSLAT